MHQATKKILIQFGVQMDHSYCFILTVTIRNRFDVSRVFVCLVHSCAERRTEWKTCQFSQYFDCHSKLSAVMQKYLPINAQTVELANQSQRDSASIPYQTQSCHIPFLPYSPSLGSIHGSIKNGDLGYGLYMFIRSCYHDVKILTIHSVLKGIVHQF